MTRFKVASVYFLSIILLAAAENSFQPGPVIPELFELDIEELLDLKFYTSGRSFEDISKVASVVSVVTSEDIKRQGLRTLNDVLKRVPGFFMDNANSVNSFIVHRGIRTDQNVGVLVLIDGHRQNMHSVYGVNSMHLFPTLYHVDRIEVTRGANSALWGSDAASAVINIITVDGSMIDPHYSPYGRFVTNFDCEFRNKQRTVNLMWGKQFENAEAMLSYTYTKSEGEPQYDYRPKVSGPEIDTQRFEPYAIMPDSHDFYLKAGVGDLSINAGFSELQTGQGQRNSFEEAQRGNAGYRRMRRLGADLSYEIEMNRSISNETTFRTDWREFTAKRLADSAAVVSEESGVEIENITRLSNGSWGGLLGFGYNRNEFESPASPNFFMVGGEEAIVSTFGELSYAIRPNFKVTAGGRIEDEDLRSDTNEFMPRASIVYGISDAWTVRYVYSTGIVRPPREYNVIDEGWFQVLGTSNYFAGTHLPTESVTQEVQFVYQAERSSFRVALFQVDMKNLFSFINQPLSGVNNPDPLGSYTLLYGSLDSVTSRGIELEAEHRFSEDLRIYGNLTYLNAFRNNDKVNGDQDASDDVRDTKYRYYDDENGATAVPGVIWNLGVDYALTEQASLNIHYRGWADYNSWYSSTSTRRVNSKHFFDLNRGSPNWSKIAPYPFMSKISSINNGRESTWPLKSGEPVGSHFRMNSNRVVCYRFPTLMVVPQILWIVAVAASKNIFSHARLRWAHPL